jgi:hypothetical protein
MQLVENLFGTLCSTWHSLVTTANSPIFLRIPVISDTETGVFGHPESEVA